MPLSDIDRRVAVERLRTYPAGFGHAWGAAPTGSVKGPQLKGCHLCCFAKDYDGAITEHFTGLADPLPVEFGDPAVHVAAARGELSTAGIFRAYEDLKAWYGDREFDRFADALSRDPRALVPVFEGEGRRAA